MFRLWEEEEMEAAMIALLNLSWNLILTLPLWAITMMDSSFFKISKRIKRVGEGSSSDSWFGTQDMSVGTEFGCINVLNTQNIQIRFYETCELQRKCHDPNHVDRFPYANFHNCKISMIKHLAKCLLMSFLTKLWKMEILLKKIIVSD